MLALLIILTAVALTFSLDPPSPTARLINEVIRSCKTFYTLRHPTLSRILERITCHDVIRSIETGLERMFAKSCKPSLNHRKCRPKKSAEHTTQTMTSLFPATDERRHAAPALVTIVCFVKMPRCIAAIRFSHVSKYDELDLLKCSVTITVPLSNGIERPKPSRISISKHSKLIFLNMM